MEKQDVIKRFADNIKTPSFNKRKNLFLDLNLLLDDPGVNKNDIMAIFKSLSRTLVFYREAHSFRLVKCLVEKLVRIDREACITSFIEAFKINVDVFRKAELLCISSSSEAFMAFKLSCILLDGCHDNLIAKLPFNQLLEQQAVFFQACLPSTPHKAIIPSRDKLFTAFIHKNHQLIPMYITALSSLSSPPLYAFSLVGFLLSYLSKTSNESANGCQGDVANGDTNYQVLADEMKKLYLSHYIEGVLKSRVKVKNLTLTSLATFLAHLNDLEFTNEVMPTINKALLRNPEITLICLRDLIRGVAIDLSAHALGIGKHLASQCLSKDEKMHLLASQSTLSLCQQCTNHQSIQALVNHFFNVLTGSEGKGAMANQKIALLTCIGNANAFTLVHGNSTLPSTSQLACSISERFGTFIQSEGHEAVCVHAISMLIGWSSKIRSSLPKSFIQCLEKILTNKNTSSNVRIAILRAFIASANAETKEDCKGILPVLTKIIETVHTGTSVQQHQVVECAHASLLLLSICADHYELAAKQSAVWSVLLDCDKQHLCHTKLLSQASKEVLQCLTSLVFILFKTYPSQLQEKHLSMYSTCLISCIAKGDNEVKREGLVLVKRLSSSPPSEHPHLPLLLATSVSQVMTSLQTLLSHTNEEVQSAPSSLDYRIFYQLYEVLAGALIGRKACEDVVLQFLVDIHHPAIVKRYSRPWLRLLKKVQVGVVELVRDNHTQVFDCFKCQGTALNQLQKNALSSLAEVLPKETFLFVRDQITPIFSNQSYLSISHSDHALLSCPEGELFDRSILESFSAANKDQANVKRENKLYSYEEQLADLEIKKELAKKRKVKEEVKLSKKQQELLHTTLTNETHTRHKLQQIKNNLLYANSLLESCIQGNKEHTRLSFIWLLPLMNKLSKSVMAAPMVTDIFVRLTFVAFTAEDQQYFADSLAHCILRHLKPECELDSNWTQESLTSQSERIVDTLFNITGCSLDRHQSFEQPFNATTFHYASLLSQSVLRTDFLGDDWLMKCLSLISCHARLRASTTDDEKSPSHLPLHSLVNLCLHLITVSTATVRDHAHQALLDLASAANGDQGCVTIGEDTMKCLLDALLSPIPSVRQSALQALLIVKEELNRKARGSTEQDFVILSRIWMCKFDVEENNRGMADSLFLEHQLPTHEAFFSCLIEDIVHSEACIRTAASASLSAALQAQAGQTLLSFVLRQLLERYEEKLYIQPIPKDQFGRVEQGYVHPPDDFQSRCGVALAIGKMGPLLGAEGVEEVLRFVVDKGLLDRHPVVQNEMLQAAICITNTHGKENMEFLFSLFENFLTTAPSTAMYDTARQGVAILMGTLAKHLSSDSDKLKPIVARLVGTLSTPSEEVQSAVANCLYPLVSHLKADAPGMVKEMMRLLFTADDYGQRKGAAYGLAGLVKGLGILSLKQLDIITALTTAIQDKKNIRHKEGALFAFEMLCKMLERLFEPYVVHLLPHLLICFGDPNQNIRDAADDTAKMVMSKLSGHGVKLVLPSLLSALEEDSWRTKCGSVELLGAMAYCAPKQLSACLPNIVPKITEVLTDSHIKVQSAGAQALGQIGRVIRNPEIQSVVPVLLAAIQDPVGSTTKALEKLLATKFVHFIDAPSLALIMPVVQRALTDRSSETRMMAAQIVANMYSLTDQKDLSPYLPTMVPGLKESLLSPMPEVRTASARAFGTMVKSMGEKGVGDLLPWLFDTLTSEASTVDRSGAAQGLAEVVGGLGLAKLKEMMPDVIETTSRVDINPCVRDGYIMLYIYLPPAFGDHFIPYVAPIIPTILQALADETEFVRETALRAGQKIVQQYADTAIELLLPEVENGLFDDNWRIRYSSIHLMGDLLFRISGVTGKMTTQGKDEDDNFGTEASQKSIHRALGVERFNRVFSGLYVCRHDSSLLVRQAALHVWKVIVSHTPRTLRDIMPTLFKLLLSQLAATSYDKRHMAALTLGDIVRKLGEKVLPEIIPILEQGLDSEDFERRQGVCFGLCEIINSTGQDHVIAFAGNLIPTIRKALMDEEAAVRQAAALTFDTLHSNLGPRCIDDILPALLEQLKNPDKRDNALDGLRQVMLVKSRVVLPHLIPSLTTEPINSRALSFLASAAGESLNKHLAKVLQALVKAVAANVEDAALLTQELEHCRMVMLSLQEDEAVQNAVEILLEGAGAGAVEKTPPACRQAALLILNIFCAESKVDYSDYVIRMIKTMIMLAGEEYEPLLQAAWMCLNSIIKKVDPVNVVQHISQMRQAMRLVCVNLHDNQLLPGFSLPKKGIAPLVLVFREAILTGSPEIKESATVGLTEAIRRSSPEALKPSVINITGALIRILGERFGFNVKVAMLDSVGLLLRKCGVNMKAFLPQLQTTFLKTLIDSNKLVRLRSAKAIGSLVDIHNRIDPLFNELIGLVKSSDDLATRASVIQAIRLCLASSNCKLQEKTQKELLLTLRLHASPSSSSSAEDEAVAMVASACVGALCGRLDEEILASVISSDLMDTDTTSSWSVKYSHSTSLSVALKESAPSLFAQPPSTLEKLKKSAVKFAASDRLPTKLRGVRCLTFYLTHQLTSHTTLDQDVLDSLYKTMKIDSTDVKQACCLAISHIACHCNEDLHSNDQLLVSMATTLLLACKDRQQVVRVAGEHSLISVLCLRTDDSLFQRCLDLMSQAEKDVLVDVSNKSLKRLKLQPLPLEEEFDNTYI